MSDLTFTNLKGMLKDWEELTASYQRYEEAAKRNKQRFDRIWEKHFPHEPLYANPVFMTSAGDIVCSPETAQCFEGLMVSDYNRSGWQYRIYKSPYLQGIQV